MFVILKMIACNENIFTICFLSLFGRAIEIYMQQREFCGIFRVMSMFFFIRRRRRHRRS